MIIQQLQMSIIIMLMPTKTSQSRLSESTIILSKFENTLTRVQHHNFNAFNELHISMALIQSNHIDINEMTHSFTNNDFYKKFKCPSPIFNNPFYENHFMGALFILFKIDHNVTIMATKISQRTFEKTKGKFQSGW